MRWRGSNEYLSTQGNVKPTLKVVKLWGQDIANLQNGRTKCFANQNYKPFKPQDLLDYMEHALAFLSDNNLTIPLAQVVMYMFICAFCFLFQKYKLGLIISYCFVFYWGFVFGGEYFVNLEGKNMLELYVYLACGLITAVLAVISFFQTEG